MTTVQLPQLTHSVVDLDEIQDALGKPDLVVLNYGMGVDSTALLLRWLHEPETRGFDLTNLVVISAQTGNEWLKTGALVEEHILPLLRKHGVRYVQVARRGKSQLDGVTVLDDTDSPEWCWVRPTSERPYFSLGEEMEHGGTVPQCAGPRRCSLKSKGWVIDQFLKGLPPVRQAMGYEVEEESRAKRDKKQDRPGREGWYPLIEWGWDRAECHAYIKAKTGVDWSKSACEFCPFALTNAAGLERTLDRYEADPDAAIRTLVLEDRSIALNPTQGLIAGKALAGVMKQRGHDGLLERLDEHLAGIEHSLYEVRRHSRRRRDGSVGVTRDLRILDRGSREQMAAAFEHAAGAREAVVDAISGVRRGWLRRAGVALPAGEHYLVVAPSGADEKCGVSREKFEQWWNELGAVEDAAEQLLLAFDAAR